MRSGIWIAVLLIAETGCFDPSTVECPDGRLCPAGTICTQGGCATPEQVVVCAGVADGTPCTTAATPAGLCRDEVCHASVCGDGFIVSPEQCDGSSLGDQTDCQDAGFYDSRPLTCTAQCTPDTSACTGFCGDGVTNGPEQCDGGATTTCQDRGFASGGTVFCNTTSCVWNVSVCS